MFKNAIGVIVIALLAAILGVVSYDSFGKDNEDWRGHFVALDVRLGVLEEEVAEISPGASYYEDSLGDSELAGLSDLVEMLFGLLFFSDLFDGAEGDDFAIDEWFGDDFFDDSDE